MYHMSARKSDHMVEGTQGFNTPLPGSGEKVLYVLSETVALHFSSNSYT